jgi:hypothetical protein
MMASFSGGRVAVSTRVTPYRVAMRAAQPAFASRVFASGPPPSGSADGLVSLLETHFIDPLRRCETPEQWFTTVEELLPDWMDARLQTAAAVLGLDGTMLVEATNAYRVQPLTLLEATASGAAYFARDTAATLTEFVLDASSHDLEKLGRGFPLFHEHLAVLELCWFTLVRRTLEPGDAVGAGLEGELEGPLHPDAVEAEVLVVEDLGAGALLEAREQAGQLDDVVFGQLLALVAQGLPHLLEQLDAVDELHLALAVVGLAVGHNPDVGVDARVVEHLVGQGDDGFEQVVLQQVAANLALARARCPGEAGGSR